MDGKPMTMRLDLRKSLDWPGRPGKPMLSSTPFGCADCGQWFQFACQLVQHICEARDAR